MNKKINSLVIGTAIAAMLAPTIYAGPASNFAASIREAGSNVHLLHSGVAEAVTSGVEVTADNTDTILTTGIKTANKKDLLIGVSLQSGIYTDTTVKGKNGSSESAEAMGGIKVKVVVTDKYGFSVDVYPSEVVFASRIQKLSANLGGVIETCEVSVEEVIGDDGLPTGESTGTINIAEDCVVTDEEIGLMLNTTSANHFNFVAPDMSPGDHKINVVATALSSAQFENGTYEVDGNPVYTTNNEAKAWALVDVGSLTVQQVRAINQAGGITTDLDTGNCYDDAGLIVTCP